ncbi:MAG: response regulator [Acidimicrobiales bacterium]
MELVLDATKAAVGEWNMLDGTLLLSDSWYRLLGYEPGTVDLTDGPWQAWVHPDDWPELQRLLEESEAAGQRLVEHTLRVRHRDGTWRWNRYRGVATEWTDAGRPARMLGIALDVTEQRSLEQQLVHSAKMQSLGAFAGGIAHDFNNVLAIVQGHTEALERSSQVQPLTDDQLARIEAIQRAVRRATSLVRSLMLLNRPSATSGKVTDLADLLHRTAASLPYLLGEDVRLDVTVPPYPVVVPVDEGRLEAALLNLAANARDAMPAGGTLTMVLDAGDDPTPSAVLRVTDTGVGMDDNTLASIFEPFFTTKMPGVGTGLGMATTYATITEANGTITATSTPGNGATITIVLPIVPVTTSAEQVPPMLPTPLRPSTSLLVVEDEAELLELTTELLEDQQFRVHSALDADEALETLERYDDIALVITDAVMPGMSGPELASIIRERWPQIPLLFMSGYSVESPATLPFGDDHVLTKPVTSEALIEAVARVLQPDGNRRDRP